MITVTNREHQIQVTNRDESFTCDNDSLLLQGMEKAGKQAIRVGCRKGGCGMCKVRVLSGHYQTLKMSRAHVSAQEEQQGFVLACRTQVQGDLVVESDHFALTPVVSPLERA